MCVSRYRAVLFLLYVVGVVVDAVVVIYKLVGLLVCANKPDNRLEYASTCQFDAIAIHKLLHIIIHLLSEQLP